MVGGMESQHDVVGTYGDFIGGVIGTLVALYSAYLLVKTLGCQISVNSDVMDTNRNIVKTNNTAIYQSFLQVFDNKFHTMFDNYKEAKQAYRYESTRKQPQGLIQSDGEKKEVVTTEPYHITMRKPSIYWPSSLQTKIIQTNVLIFLV